ncbi:u3 small nucleolar rna-associated protein 18 [Plasmopara halstedii]|uniref:U3 small nucleolar RNA-associated protein 18 homolog n=1 Tax=Plasmopara halstedii TaxID=4781 RepID=A0A0P1AK42_PLAHL|nr:u3 small nucleolar rna-associated protein 18 [Plasmopara halstedii]CEG41372.1 u3 small nucleolar rna-associated protein 18 [Plasmopara halstedii]|eukprot:XP_024577741.1 u3 small nucleolar rna-associated protein 18 [Plasmopara halstedii]
MAPVTKAEKLLTEEVFLTNPNFKDNRRKRLHQSKSEQDNTKQKFKAAWVDDDDEDVVVNLKEQPQLRKLRETEEDTIVDGPELKRRLKTFYQAAHGAISWADPTKFLSDHQNVPDDSDNEEEADLFRSTSKLLEESGEMLPQGSLDVIRMKDANQHAPSNAVIQSVQFHPNGQILLTAGLDKTFCLFQVDGSNNANIEKVFVQDLPMLDAKFTLGGDRAILTGPRQYYFSYDIQAGKITKIPGLYGRKERKREKFAVSNSGDTIVFLGSNGYLDIVSAKSYESIGTLKMNGSVNSAVFCENDRFLLSTGSDGQIYKWDMRTRRCIFVHDDEGSLCNHALAASGKYYAAGSKSGVVNIYDNAGLTAKPKPCKALMHLTTQVDHLKFNPSSEILAMASTDIKDSLKMVHMPSLTVFPNWPTAHTPLHYVSAMDFSPNSGYFAVGNARGRVLLYRLTHYKAT